MSSSAERMTRWATFKSLFNMALELPPEDRDAFISRAIPDDASLRDRLATLLRSFEEAEGFLDQPLINLEALGRAAAEPAMSPGDQVGPYRLLGILGDGGMGQVYLGERGDGQFEKQVAIKFLQPSISGRSWLSRFERERQILASFEHPNIARLVDGGTDQKGGPYIVMEFVSGTPLDLYCRRLQLLRDRLRIFLQVCHAVQVAHQSLIVHRDLKPSNILVAEDGSVKLLDFGIAKLLESPSDATELTRAGFGPMTLQYASPEQLRGQQITTATDVYALGLILFEILTGTRPYDVGGLSHGEVKSVVRDHDHEPPSARLAASSKLDPSSRSDASNQALQKRFSKQVQGDLDSIVLKAMAEEPSVRYGTAEQLAEDLKRYLGGMPVKARRWSIGYRAKKFVQRNLASVLAGLMIAVLLVGFSVATALQSSRVREALREAKRQLDSKVQVVDFLVEVFEVSDPERAGGDDITAREILQSGAERIEEALKEQPLVRADLLTVIGRVHRSLGYYAEAEPLLAEALALRRQHRDNSLEVVQSLHELAALHFLAERYSEAETEFSAALALRNQIPGDEDPDVATILNNIVVLYMRSKSDLQTAADMIERAIADRERRLGSIHPDLATSLNNLSEIYRQLGRDSEAVAPLVRAVEIMEQNQRADDPNYGIFLSNLGSRYLDIGDFEQAIVHMEGSVRILEKTLGEHQYLGSAVNNLGQIYYLQGELELARPLFQRGFDLFSRTIGEDSELVAFSANNLASVEVRLGNYQEAEALFRRALEIREKRLEPNHRHIVFSLNKLAELLLLEGSFPEAGEKLDRALASARVLLRDDPGNSEETGLMAWTHVLRGRLYESTGDPAAAEKEWSLAATLMTPLTVDSDVTRFLYPHAWALLHLGRTDDARPLVRKLLAIGGNPPDFIEMCRERGLLETR